MKKILLIGGNGVLGSTYVENFIINKNYKIAVLDLDNKNIKHLKSFTFIKTDISKFISFEKNVKLAIKKLGGIDVLINNAAFTSELAKKNNIKFEDFDMKTWEHSIKINLTSVFFSCKIVIPHMIKKKYGKIINISSLYGHLSPSHYIYDNENFNCMPSYSASKSGVIGLTKWLATKYASNGLMINCISPGGVFNNQSKTFVKKYSKINPSKKMANRKDLLGLINFLISDESNYIIGQNIKIDGGHSVW